MKHNPFKPAAGLLVLLLLAATATPAATGTDATRYIDPFIGTGAVDASSLKGGTFPGAACPFGMVQLSPDVLPRPRGVTGSGYDYAVHRIYGFSHTHLSGTGMADLMDIQFMPSTRPIEQMVRAADNSTAFSHANEQAEAGYYSVVMDNGLRAELTATCRTGVHRYTFPAGGANSLMIDLSYVPVYKPTKEADLYDAQLRLVSPTAVQGYHVVGGWTRLRKVYFYAEFSRPIAGTILTARKYIINQYEPDTLRDADLINGNAIKGFLSFAPSGEPLLVRVGLSAVSCEGARRNLEAERPDFDFDGTRRAARQAWQAVLNNISIDGTEQQKRIFYTGLYHAYLQPNTFSDVDGRYLAPDYTVGQVPAGATQLTTYSLWDTYRAAHPLYTLLQPERVADMVGSMLRYYDVYGYLPIWQLWGTENYCMIGNHAIPVLVDATLKGLAGASRERVYEAVRTSAMREHHNSLFRLLDSYGYLPCDKQPQSVSIALEQAYDDACVARLARALGREEDAAYFDRRAHLYRNLFDPATGFFRAKLSNGRWLEPFNPLEYGANGDRPFTEGNAWQYRWYVPQDVPDLIRLMGGPRRFEQRLDSFFTLTDDKNVKNHNISGMIGQYAHGNEPSHHCIYLYNLVGADRKAQYYANRVLRELYTDNYKGYAGNEDCGQMSAWYVLSAMGFYPLDPASGVYYFGSPQLPRVSIGLPGGRTFTIITHRRGADDCYIRRVRLNGRPYRHNYIRHTDITAGGTLEFFMGR